MAWATAAVSRLIRGAARIRVRLLLINVIVAAVPVVGMAFARMHEHQLLAALEADLVHQAELVRAFVAADPSPDRAADRAALLTAVARETRARIRLLDAAGAVVADSHADAPAPESVAVAGRSEVVAALAGHYGAATRYWDKQGRVYLFVALPIAGGGVVYVTRSTHDVKLQLYRLRTWLARLLAATLAVTTVLSLVLATTIARPLGQLTRRAQRIAARQPVAPDRLAERRDEIGEVARAVAAMTDELERRARDARTLASDISHEFKTPLAGIRGAAELLHDGTAADPVDRERFLAMIIDDTARLDRLVARLLDLARVDDDRAPPEPIELASLVRDTAARAWACPVEVAAAGPVHVSARPAALASAIDNLVANAVQHAAAGSAVAIGLDAQGAAVRITVANRGVALSATARARVWDRFYSTRVAAGGSGLGLAIVRSVALAHGGSYGVACRDGITAFWIELPRAS